MDELSNWLSEIEALTGLSRSSILALVVLAVGWIAAFVAKGIVGRLVHQVERWLPSRPAGADLSQSARRTDVILGRGVFWLVLLLALMTATELLGFPVITTWLGAVASYLPRVLVALLIVVVGAFGGALLKRTLIRSLPPNDVIAPRSLAHATYLTVVGLSVLVAVQQLNIEVGFVMVVVAIAFSGLLTAAAISFGLGSRLTVTNILAGHHVRELYEVGQTIQVGETQGRIIRITATNVILETGNGETAIPSSTFLEQPSTLLQRGDA